MRIFFVLFMSLIYINSVHSQKSPFLKITEEVKTLRKETKYKQDKINELEYEVRQLTKQKTFTNKSYSKLEKSITAKTSEILELRAQLKSQLADYGNLIEQIEFVKDESEEYKNAVKDLTKAKNDLESGLMSANKNIILLTDSLKNSKFENAYLTGKTQMLENTINELLGVHKGMAFLEFGGSIPNKLDVSLSFGMILKGNAFFLGLDVSYLYISKNDAYDPTYYPDIRMSLIPVKAVAKIPVGKRKLGFRFVDPQLPLFERSNYLVSIDFGYAPVLSSTVYSSFDRGGVSAAVEFEAVLSPFETINTFISTGIDFQQVRQKEMPGRLLNDQKGIFGWHLGLGINL